MNYRFQNLLGAPYRGGNAVISKNTQLISLVGNRFSITDLIKSQTVTLPVQSLSNICRLAVSPDGTFLLTVDENQRCLFINLHCHGVLDRVKVNYPVNAGLDCLIRFCFVTFTEHTNAVTAHHFVANNHCLLSAFLDGLVRAWDLFRYRNFRTCTTLLPDSLFGSRSNW